MPTIDDYINQLKTDKGTLKTNLETKGISGLSSNDTFTELVPRVLDIVAPNLQTKSLTISTNTTTNIEPDSPYNGLSSVSVTTNVAPDLSEYFTYNVIGSVQSCIKKIPEGTTVTGSTLMSAFSGCAFLESIPLMDISSVTNMQNTFQNCVYLTSIPLLNTGNVTSMQNCFYGCARLTNVPLLNTSRVTSFQNCFYGCTALTSIPALDTSSATSIQGMFNGCTNLTTVPVFDVSHVPNMNTMFRNCNNLTNDSLNNILYMCAHATSYTGQKTLDQVGIFTSTYPATTIQGLSNYQAFVDAGWSIS